MSVCEQRLLASAVRSPQTTDTQVNRAKQPACVCSKYLRCMHADGTSFSNPYVASSSPLLASASASASAAGSVDNADVVIVDDMIDTAGTLCTAAANLKANGARRVYAFASHGLFSGPASDRIARSVLEEVRSCTLY